MCDTGRDTITSIYLLELRLCAGVSWYIYMLSSWGGENNGFRNRGLEVDGFRVPAGYGVGRGNFCGVTWYLVCWRCYLKIRAGVVNR